MYSVELTVYYVQYSVDLCFRDALQPYWHGEGAQGGRGGVQTRLQASKVETCVSQ